MSRGPYRVAFGTRQVVDSVGAVYCEAPSTWKAERIAAALTAVENIPTEALQELPGDAIAFVREMKNRLAGGKAS